MWFIKNTMYTVNYRECIKQFDLWCDENYLHLNATKTKELIFCLKRKNGQQPVIPVNVGNFDIEIIQSYKYSTWAPSLITNLD